MKNSYKCTVYSVYGVTNDISDIMEGGFINSPIVPFIGLCIDFAFFDNGFEENFKGEDDAWFKIVDIAVCGDEILCWLIKCESKQP